MHSSKALRCYQKVIKPVLTQKHAKRITSFFQATMPVQVTCGTRWGNKEKTQRHMGKRRMRVDAGEEMDYDGGWGHRPSFPPFPSVRTRLSPKRKRPPFYLLSHCHIYKCIPWELLNLPQLHLWAVKPPPNFDIPQLWHHCFHRQPTFLLLVSLPRHNLDGYRGRLGGLLLFLSFPLTTVVCERLFRWGVEWSSERTKWWDDMTIPFGLNPPANTRQPFQPAMEAVDDDSFHGCSTISCDK